MTTSLPTLRRIALNGAGCLGVACLLGCTSITATSVTATGTNTFHAFAFFAHDKVEKLDVASTTKTTTKLIGAKNTEVSGDVEMVKALAEALRAATAEGAKAAAK